MNSIAIIHSFQVYKLKIKTNGMRRSASIPDIEEKISFAIYKMQEYLFKFLCLCSHILCQELSYLLLTDW